MKLMNAIAIYDVFIVANSSEEARKTLLGLIKSDEIQPNEIKAFESHMSNSIRDSWRDQKPFVADDISDAEFNKHIKGHTTIEIFQHIYEKRG